MNVTKVELTTLKSAHTLLNNLASRTADDNIDHTLGSNHTDISECLSLMEGILDGCDLETKPVITRTEMDTLEAATTILTAIALSKDSVGSAHDDASNCLSFLGSVRNGVTVV